MKYVTAIIAIATTLTTMATNVYAQQADSLTLADSYPKNGSTIAIAEISNMSLTFNAPVQVRNDFFGKCVTISDVTVGSSYINMKGTVDESNPYKVNLEKARYNNTGDFYEGHTYLVDINNFSNTYFSCADGSALALSDTTFFFTIAGGGVYSDLFVKKQSPGPGEIIRNAGSAEFNTRLTSLDISKVKLTNKKGHDVTLSSIIIDPEWEYSIAINIDENESLIPNDTYYLHLKAGAVTAGGYTNEEMDAAHWIGAPSQQEVHTGNGTASDPYILVDGVAAPGPKANTSTYYTYTAEKDGVLEIAHTFTGSVQGYITIGDNQYSFGTTHIVSANDVVLFNLMCEEDNSGETITATLNEVASGMTQSSAIVLTEGDNSIDAINSGDIPVWYKFTIPAAKRGTLTFTGYPALNAYVGEDLSTELGTGNPVDYINQSSEEVVVYIKIQTTNGVPLTAKLQYAEPIADLTKFGTLAYSIEPGSTIGFGEAITLTFPNRTGGAGTKTVTANFYIFRMLNGNPNGAPVNLGDETIATGTLDEGVEIAYDLPKGNFRLAIQSLSCDGHNAPNQSEPTLTNNSIDFTVGNVNNGISEINGGDSTRQIYNITGQHTSNDDIIIVNGKKVMTKTKK